MKNAVHIHIKCAGVSRTEYFKGKSNPTPWFCTKCSAPCGICNGHVLNEHKAVQCDRCDIWIHTNCCDIDDQTYETLINSSCSWACPGCDCYNFSDSFFRHQCQTHNLQLFWLTADNSQHTLQSNIGTHDRPGKKHFRQPSNRSKKRDNFKCIIINCQSIRGKSAVISSLHRWCISTYA